MSKLTREDLDLLRDTAARFFDEKLPIGALRKLRDEQNKTGFDRNLWREMANMGWAGILIDEDNGGIDFGYVALGIILEQSGRTLAASPLISTVLTCAPIVTAGGTDEQRQNILGGVASGDLVLALAHEEFPRHAPYRIATRAVENGKGYLIDGGKTFVLDGHVADYLILTARTAGEDDDRDGVTLFLVDARLRGINIKRTTMVDSRNAANIEFEQAQIPADSVIGSPGNGAEILDRVLDGARAGTAAEMLGIGQEAFDITTEYLKVREQFGAPIGSFQALKHRAADMYCEIELARSAVYAALTALDNDAPDTPELVCVAKAKACDMLELVSSEAIQMHGGIGMTDEADVGLFLKRARVTQQMFGDVIFHRERFADLIGL
ncbi:MAG: acyl-CoA dehydrogenase [Gammaproteobacteria bacterium]